MGGGTVKGQWDGRLGDAEAKAGAVASYLFVLKSQRWIHTIEILP